METGINPLIVKNTDDYDRLLAFNFYKPIPIPSFVKKVLAEKAAKASEFNQKIFKESLEADFLLLESKLGMIKAPTLIVWGDSDRVIHVSSVPVFEKKIKNARSVIIKECGHLPMLEKPQETADAYKDFLKGKSTGISAETVKDSTRCGSHTLNRRCALINNPPHEWQHKMVQEVPRPAHPPHGLRCYFFFRLRKLGFRFSINAIMASMLAGPPASLSMASRSIFRAASIPAL